jgi:[ribosomal protein S18]-alanine N-acetyltransferase
VLIRKLELRDIEDVLAIQHACPEAAQWSGADYEGVDSGAVAIWVAQDDAGIVGFLVARSLLGESEILNFAVHPDCRRRGLGSALLAHALEWSKHAHDRRLMLEVRASNVAAQKFYERHGFRVVGRRGHYYSNPTEEALLLDCVL